MGVTSYYSFGGEILGEETDGVRRDYLTDALGSVTATVTGAGTVENTYRYKPYGETLAKTGGGSDPKFLWNGKSGYRTLNSQSKICYVRSRNYYQEIGRWMTVDPYWPKEDAYMYAKSNPTYLIDPSGCFNIVPACILACVGSVGCIGGILYGCDKWKELGYSSYLECALDSYGKLPPISRVGCGLTTIGCLICLGRHLTKCEQPVCPDNLREALQDSVKQLCRKPGDKRRCNKGMDCAELTENSMKFVACISARLAINIICFLGGDKGHWEEIGGETIGLTKCIGFMKYKKCPPFDK